MSRHRARGTRVTVRNAHGLHHPTDDFRRLAHGPLPKDPDPGRDGSSVRGRVSKLSSSFPGHLRALGSLGVGKLSATLRLAFARAGQLSAKLQQILRSLLPERPGGVDRSASGPLCGVDPNRRPAALAP